MAHEGSIGQVLCRAPLSQRSTTMLGTKFTRFPPPLRQYNSANTDATGVTTPVAQPVATTVAGVATALLVQMYKYANTDATGAATGWRRQWLRL